MCTLMAQAAPQCDSITSAMASHDSEESVCTHHLLDDVVVEGCIACCSSILNDNVRSIPASQPVCT